LQTITDGEAGLKLALRLTAALFLSAGAAAGQELPNEGPRALQSPGNAQWAADPQEARSRAAAENKLVFVEFEGEECGNCQRMKSLLYPAFDFEALLIGMVPVKVDLESAAARELRDRYGVSEAPAILILSPEGRIVFRMEGFLNAPDFYRHVHQDLDAYRKFVRKVEAQDVPRLPAGEALATGRELYERSDPGAALPRLVRAASHPKATAAQRDEAREVLAAVEMELERPAAARQTINRLIATTKSAERRERAELFRAQIPLAENKPAEALALFRKFAKDHPRSAHLPQVREIVEKLESAVGKP
jgi:thioredoxin-related protein